MFNCGDEITGFEKALVGSGIQPGDAAAEKFDLEFSALQVFPVDIRDFQFTPRGGFEILRNLHNGIVVEV